MGPVGEFLRGLLNINGVCYMIKGRLASSGTRYDHHVGCLRDLAEE